MNLPKGWEEKELGDVCEIKGGKRLPKGTTFSTNKTPRPYLRVVDMSNKSISLKNIQYIDEETFKKIKNYTISHNDVYITIAGTIGLCGIIPSDLDGASLTENAAKIIINDIQKLDKKFLVYALDTREVKHQISKLTGVVGVPKLALFRIKKLKIPLPSLPTQCKIVAILEKAEAIKQKRQQIEEYTNQVLQSFFIEMFGEPETNPKKWELKSLGEVSDKITDGKHGDCANLQDSGYYFISAKDLINGHINYINARQIQKEDFLEVHKRTDLDLGDVLISNSGTIGKIALATDADKVRKTTFQKSVAIIKNKKQILGAHFLATLLNLNKNTLTKASSGSSQKNLLLGDLKKHEIILPPISLQQKFACIYEKFELIKQKQQENQKYSEELFNSLMQRAFAGELVN